MQEVPYFTGALPLTITTMGMSFTLKHLFLGRSSRLCGGSRCLDCLHIEVEQPGMDVDFDGNGAVARARIEGLG